MSGSRPRRGGLVADRLLEPLRRFARRRRQGDEGRRGVPGDRLLVEQRQQSRHGRGLPRPWPAGDDGDPAQDGGRGGQWLQVIRVRRLGVRFGEQLLSPARSSVEVDVDHLGGRAAPGALCHGALVEPEPIQVQLRSRQVQGVAVPDERALRPLRRARPRGPATAARRCRSAGRGLRWRSPGWSAGRHTRGRAVAPGRRRRSRGRRPRRWRRRAVPARRATWTSEPARIPASLKARQAPGCPDGHGRVVAIEADTVRSRRSSPATPPGRRGRSVP